MVRLLSLSVQILIQWMRCHPFKSFVRPPCCLVLVLIIVLWTAKYANHKCVMSERYSNLKCVVSDRSYVLSCVCTHACVNCDQCMLCVGGCRICWLACAVYWVYCIHWLASAIYWASVLCSTRSTFHQARVHIFRVSTHWSSTMRLLIWVAFPTMINSSGV